MGFVQLSSEDSDRHNHLFQRPRLLGNLSWQHQMSIPMIPRSILRKLKKRLMSINDSNRWAIC